jgi:Flp pilus assembly pilin Flp
MKSRLGRDSRGVAAIEYALVAALISIAAVAGYGTLGSKIHAQYANIDNRMAEHM